MYLVKTPWWLKSIYPSYTWKIPTADKVLYLTFDDGPHETATPFVLDTLQQYNAKATFFCIGKNVTAHKHIYQRIIDEGHRVGNHTYNHLNGWKTKDDAYIKDVIEAAKEIDSNLFRPPYGRIKKFQGKLLSGKMPVNNEQQIAHSFLPLHIIMWDVLSGDFDININGEQCAENVLLNAQPGSIIVFHDSTKAWPRMSYALPLMLEHFSGQGYQFKTIPVIN
ncbi:MAG: polysaccharide deacetylase family protein [Bacteroidota bacterium]|nr:polysaccharide deacetylase family protein [Bacteroidota bacterium]